MVDGEHADQRSWRSGAFCGIDRSAPNGAVVSLAFQAAIKAGIGWRRDKVCADVDVSARRSTPTKSDDPVFLPI